MYKVNWRSKIFFVINIFLFQTVVNSQIRKSLQTDTLKKDSVEHNKIFVSKSDTIDNFVPIDNIAYSEITENYFINIKKIPKKAALFSTILPGLGQAYNEKYWKIPIIYGIFTGMYYLYSENNFRYNLYRNAYNKYTANEEDGGPIVKGGNHLSLTQLEDKRDKYRRGRDYNIIIGTLIYILNILDANVDAHLMNFDVSDDLSMTITPVINNYSIYNQVNHSYDMKNSFGLKFAISINKR